MNNEAVISNLCKMTGASRKQVIDVLKKMSAMPEVKKYIRDNAHGRK